MPLASATVRTTFSRASAAVDMHNALFLERDAKTAPPEIVEGDLLRLADQFFTGLTLVFPRARVEQI
jgi:hypothetical protein